MIPYFVLLECVHIGTTIGANQDRTPRAVPYKTAGDSLEKFKKNSRRDFTRSSQKNSIQNS